MRNPAGGLPPPKGHFQAASCCAWMSCRSWNKKTISGSAQPGEAIPFLFGPDDCGRSMLNPGLFKTEGSNGIAWFAAARFFPAETQRKMATPLAFVSCAMTAAGSAFVSLVEGHNEVSA